MEINIDKLTEAELIDLNRRIVERLKMIHQLKAHGAMMNYRVGERVYFLDNDNQKVYGVLTKYNRKTVTVIADSGLKWKVSPTLLNKIEDDDVVEIKPEKNLIG